MGNVPAAPPLPERLGEFLRACAPHGRCLAACSGGLDSMVLLHALAACRPRLPAPLHALHVLHRGLSPRAAEWAAHCEACCKAWAVPLRVLCVEARAPPGKSFEAWARARRYAAFAQALRPGEVLLTAQHGDDQVETLLLRLLRGSGPRGLAAMPVSRPLGCGLLLRPLLPYGRAELRAYAERHGVRWVEDESNAELRADRNYLRHCILPLVRRRWPGSTVSLRRARDLQAWAGTLLDSQARADLAEVNREPFPAATLELAALRVLPEARAVNILHYWLRMCGRRAPDARLTRRILRELLPTGGGSPRLSLGGAQLRRYRNRLYLLPEPAAAAPLAAPQTWRLPAPLSLPGGLLRARHRRSSGLAARHCPADLVEVRTRRGGERLHPAGRGCSRPLKKLWQEWGVPPWLRPGWPLLYAGGRLAAVPGHAIAQEFAAGPDEPAWQPCWEVLEADPKQAGAAAEGTAPPPSVTASEA